jgi:hypothetical protein
MSPRASLSFQHLNKRRRAIKLYSGAALCILSRIGPPRRRNHHDKITVNREGHSRSAITYAPPSAPRYRSKRRFGLEFNNYLRLALTLRGVSSESLELDPCHVHVHPDRRQIHTASKRGPRCCGAYWVR